jgi:hypothetical protein
VIGQDTVIGLVKYNIAKKAEALPKDHVRCVKMEKQKTVLVSVIALAIAALSFWITLSIIDYGFSGIFHKVFP